MDEENGEQRFRIIGLEKDEKGGGGDSFDFYPAGNRKGLTTGFLAFHAARRMDSGGEEIPPYSADSEDSSGASSAGSTNSTESEEEALEKETRRIEEWYGKKTTSTPDERGLVYFVPGPVVKGKVRHATITVRKAAKYYSAELWLGEIDFVLPEVHAFTAILEEAGCEPNAGMLKAFASC